MIGKQFTQGVLVLGLLLALSACNSKSESEFKSQEKGKSVEPAHIHHDYGPGPHNGRMADLGSDHTLVAEIVYLGDPRSITVYVVGHNDQKKPMPVEAKSMTLELHEGGSVTLAAEPLEGEEGKSSKFAVKGDKIPESIKDQEDIEGHLKVEIGGKTVEAEFHHDEEGHDEGK